MKMRNLSKLFALLAFVAIFGLSPLIVRAIEGTTEPTTTTSQDSTTSNSDGQTDGTPTAQSRADSLREKAAAAKEQVKERVTARLEGKELEVCHKREQKIQNIFVNIADRSQGHYEQISNAFTRVEAFYIAQGLSIDSYNGLISEINTDKELALTAVTTIKDQKPQFNCGDDNPKAQAEEYKAVVKEKISALVKYRDAVRKLIDTIKTNLPTTGVTSNEK